MKWHKDKVGDTRILVKFLLLPREINNEVRWLEKASFEQERAYVWAGENAILCWIDKRWIDIK